MVKPGVTQLMSDNARKIWTFQKSEHILSHLFSLSIYLMGLQLKCLWWNEESRTDPGDLGGKWEAWRYPSLCGSSYWLLCEKEGPLSWDVSLFSIEDGNLGFNVFSLKNLPFKRLLCIPKHICGLFAVLACLAWTLISFIAGILVPTVQSRRYNTSGDYWSEVYW